MPRSILPNGYYYTFLIMDCVFPAMFGIMTLFNPMQAYADQLPRGYDKAGDLLLGTHSPRVALTALIGAVMGPVWAITTAYLLPLARNGMKDRPDLQEKVVRAHLISGAIVDPFHVAAFLYYVPTDLLLNPSQWCFSIPMGIAWGVAISALKIAWCLGLGRATAAELSKAGKKE